MSLYLIIQTLLNSLQYGSVLALSSFAIILIFKTSVTTNFAQGMISVFGAHVTAYMFTIMGLSIYLGLFVGVLVSVAMGFLIDSQLLRNARRITPIGKQMITMGIVLFLSGLIPVVFGLTPIEIPKLMEGNFMLTVGGDEYVLPYHSLISTVVTIVLLTVLFLMLRFTKWGLGVRATASNETVAAMMGVNTRQITAISWAIAGGLGALAAIFYGATLGFSATYMTGVQVNGFLAAILGGFSTFYGPVVGALIITIAGNLIGFSYSLWKDVIVYGLILLVILFKPLGLFGKKTIKKV